MIAEVEFLLCLAALPFTVDIQLSPLPVLFRSANPKQNNAAGEGGNWMFFFSEREI